MASSRRAPFGSMGSFMYAAKDLPSGDEDYAVASLEELPPEMLRGFVEPGSKEWMEFARTSHVLRRKLDDGPAVVSISRLPSAGGAGKVRGKSWLPSHLESPVARGIKPGSRTFELAQFFSDRDIIEKFSITSAQINRYRAMASVDILAAGRALQQLVREHEGFEDARVSTAKYATSWKAARETLLAHASRFPVITVTTEALFVGDKLFVYCTRDREAWSVRGSERTASLVRAVHRMVEAASPETIIFALGPELTVLNIDIIVAGTVLSPCREQHMGPHSELPVNVSSSFLEKVSSVDRQRLMALVSAVVSVEVDGEPMGSAVRVSKNHAITCEHLISASGEVTLSGSVSPALRPISRDMWFVELPGQEINWPLRTAVVDEMVVLCYRRYETLNWFGPVRILSVDRVQLTYTKLPGLAGGMSGAAIISINDFSMLGIHEGTTLAHAIGSVYSPRMHTELWRTEPSLLEPIGVAQEQPYAELSRRGLRSAIDTIYDCIDPVYNSDVYCGSLLRIADLCVFPHTLVPTVGESHPEFGVQVAGFSSLKYARTGDPERHFLRPPLIRGPVFGELAAIVARDRDGDYSSNAMRPVSELDVRTGRFDITLEAEDAGAPFVGGVVVACADGAVLGIVTSAFSLAVNATTRYACEIIDTDIVETCVTSVAVREIAASLPFVRFSGWPSDVQEAVIKLVKTAEVGLLIRHALGLGRMIVLSRFNVALDRKECPLGEREAAIGEFFTSRRTLMRMSGAHRDEFRLLIDVDYGGDVNVVADKFASVANTLIGLCMIYDKPEVVDRMIEFFYPDL